MSSSAWSVAGILLVTISILVILVLVCFGAIFAVKRLAKIIAKNFVLRYAKQQGLPPEIVFRNSDSEIDLFAGGIAFSFYALLVASMLGFVFLDALCQGESGLHPDMFMLKIMVSAAGVFCFVFFSIGVSSALAGWKAFKKKIDGSAALSSKTP